MKSELGAILLIALVAGSVGLASYEGVHPLASTATATSSGGCAQVVPSLAIIAVIMKPDSSGVVCITYVGGDVSQPSPPLRQPAGIYDTGPNGSMHGNGQAPGVNATFVSNVGRVAGNVTVQYLITVAKNVEAGAYAVWVGSMCQGGFPLVVGNITSAMPNLLAYYGSGGGWHCPPSNYFTLMTGVSAGVTYQQIL